MGPGRASSFFFIIGAQRCGTSLLRQLLDDHPGIEMARPFRPETKWFLRPAASSPFRRFVTQLFDDAGAPCWRGEKATSYLEYASVAERIAREVPDARIVVVVRDPIARAVSNYAFSVQHGVETRSIEEALAPDVDEPPWDDTEFSVSPYAYLRRGRYIDYVRPWSSRFGSRLKIVLFEDLVADRAAGDIITWFGLDDVAPTNPPPRVNPSEVAGHTLSAALRHRLEEFFHPPNLELASAYSVDVSAWSAPGVQESQ